MAALDEDVLALASGPNFASFTTLNPDGTPVATLVWVDAEGDDLLVNTERHRLKYRNACRDPRVHLLIVDGDDPGHFAAVQGVVTGTEGGEAALDHIDRLCRKYQGADFDRRRIVSERVVIRISPARQHVRQSQVVSE